MERVSVHLAGRKWGVTRGQSKYPLASGHQHSIYFSLFLFFFKEKAGTFATCMAVLIYDTLLYIF